MLARSLYSAFFFTGVASASSYALTIALTYWLVPEIYGRYLLAIAWGAGLGLIVDFATSSVFSHMAIREYPERRAIGIVLGIRTNLFSIVAAFIVLSSLMPFGGVPRESVVFLLPALNFGYIYEFIGKNVLYAKLQAVDKILFASLFLFFYYSKLDPSTSLVVAYFLAATSSILLQLYFVRSKVFGVEWGSYSEFWVYGRVYGVFVVMAIAQYTYGGWIRVFIERDFGVEVFASVSLALQLVAFTSIAQCQIDRVFRPQIVKTIGAGYAVNWVLLKASLLKYVIFAWLPIAILSLLVFVYAHQIFDLIFDENYRSGGMALRIVSPLIATVGLIRLCDHLFLSLDRFYVNFFLTLGVVISFLCSLFFFPPNSWSEYLQGMVAFQLIHILVATVLLTRMFGGLR